MNRGSAILTAGLAGAVALPLLAFGLHLPLWIDGGVGLMTVVGVYLVSRKGGAAADLDDEPLRAARNQTGQSLLADGAAALSRLERAGRSIKDADMRLQIATLANTGAGVLRDVKADPGKAMAVRRLLTFYMPNAANLAEGWQTLEQRATPSPERSAQIRQTIQSLNDAFKKFADDLVEPQMQSLDLDLKVVGDALKSDLETA